MPRSGVLVVHRQAVQQGRAVVLAASPLPSAGALCLSRPPRIRSSRGNFARNRSRMASSWSQYFPPEPEWSIDDVPDQTGKVFLITGGSTGLGASRARSPAPLPVLISRAAAGRARDREGRDKRCGLGARLPEGETPSPQILLARNARVYITARSAEKGRRAIDELRRTSEAIRVLCMDLADLHSVRRAAGEFLRSVPCVRAQSGTHLIAASRSAAEKGSCTSSSTTREPSLPPPAGRGRAAHGREQRGDGPAPRRAHAAELRSAVRRARARALLPHPAPPPRPPCDGEGDGAEEPRAQLHVRDAPGRAGRLHDAHARACARAVLPGPPAQAVKVGESSVQEERRGILTTQYRQRCSLRLNWQNNTASRASCPSLSTRGTCTRV